jgi:hypothetical protein
MNAGYKSYLETQLSYWRPGIGYTQEDKQFLTTNRLDANSLEAALLYGNCDVFLRQGRDEKAQDSENICDHGL